MAGTIGHELGFELARFWNKLLADNELRGEAKRAEGFPESEPASPCAKLPSSREIEYWQAMTGDTDPWYGSIALPLRQASYAPALLRRG
jgi:hypothetical protein